MNFYRFQFNFHTKVIRGINGMINIFINRHLSLFFICTGYKRACFSLLMAFYSIFADGYHRN